MPVPPNDSKIEGFEIVFSALMLNVTLLKFIFLFNLSAAAKPLRVYYVIYYCLFTTPVKQLPR